jgi:hypothetical protein
VRVFEGKIYVGGPSSTTSRHVTVEANSNTEAYRLAEAKLEGDDVLAGVYEIFPDRNACPHCGLANVTGRGSVVCPSCGGRVQ